MVSGKIFFFQAEAGIRDLGRSRGLGDVYKSQFPSRAKNAEGYFLSRAVMEWFCGHYLANPALGTDWRVSPLRATSLKGAVPADPTLSPLTHFRRLRITRIS